MSSPSLLSYPAGLNFIGASNTRSIMRGEDRLSANWPHIETIGCAYVGLPVSGACVAARQAPQSVVRFRAEHLRGLLVDRMAWDGVRGG